MIVDAARFLDHPGEIALALVAGQGRGLVGPVVLGLVVVIVVVGHRPFVELEHHEPAGRVEADADGHGPEEGDGIAPQLAGVGGQRAGGVVAHPRELRRHLVEEDPDPLGQHGHLLLLDQPGANAWPITGATFILVHSKQTEAKTGHDVLAFFDWCYKNGNSAAEALDYVPMPGNVVNAVRKLWASEIKDPSGKPIFALSN